MFLTESEPALLEEATINQSQQSQDLKESRRNPTTHTPRARSSSKAKARCSGTASSGLQANQGARTLSGTLGTQQKLSIQQGCHCNFPPSHHLHGGVGGNHKRQVFSITEGSCPRKIQLKVLNMTTPVDFLSRYNLMALHTLC